MEIRYYEGYKEMGQSLDSFYSALEKEHRVLKIILKF